MPINGRYYNNLSERKFSKSEIDLIFVLKFIIATI